MSTRALRNRSAGVLPGKASTSEPVTDENQSGQTEAAVSQVGSRVAHTFNNLQSSVDVDREHEELCSIFDSTPLDEFHIAFKTCLKKLLVVFKTTSQIVYCEQLVARFVSSKEAYQKKFFEMVFKALQSKEKAARLRALSMIRRFLLHQQESQIDITMSLHSELVKQLATPSLDKNAQVRQEAVLCYEFLQVLRDERVSQVLSSMADEDPSDTVRRSVVRVLHKEERQVFLSSLNDSNEKVRFQVLKEFLDRFSVEDFSHQELLFVFESSLYDSSEAVRKASIHFLEKLSMESSSLEILLTKFQADFGNEESILRILKFLPKPQPSEIREFDTSKGVVPSKEYALLVRFVLEHHQDLCEELNGLNTVETIRNILCKLDELCTEQNEDSEDIRRQEADLNFTLKQCVVGCLYLDCDPMSRTEIKNCITDALLRNTFSEDTVASMMETLKRCFDDMNQYYIHVFENIASDLQELTDLERLEQETQKTKAVIQQCTLEQRYSLLPPLVEELASLEKSLEEQRSSGNMACAHPKFSRMVRAIAVVNGMLQCTSLDAPEKYNLFEVIHQDFCTPALQSLDARSKFFGIQVLGTLCLGNLEFSQSQIEVILNEFLADSEEDAQVRGKALEIVIDLLLKHEHRMFQTSEDGFEQAMEAFDQVIRDLSGFCFNERHEYQYVSIVGLCKLVLLHRAPYPSLIETFMILLLHEDLVDDDSKAKHCLGLFFSEYRQMRLLLQASTKLLKDMVEVERGGACERIDPDLAKILKQIPIEVALERLCFLFESSDLQLELADTLIRILVEVDFDKKWSKLVVSKGLSQLIVGISDRCALGESQNDTVQVEPLSKLYFMLVGVSQSLQNQKALVNATGKLIHKLLSASDRIQAHKLSEDSWRELQGMFPSFASYESSEIVGLGAEDREEAEEEEE